MVEVLASTDDSGPAPAPDLSEWTPTVAHLAKISDQIQALRIAVIAGNGGKAPDFRPESRPVTGVQKARNMRDLQNHYDLVDEVKAAQARWELNRESGATGDG